jgi:glycerol uptake facilitator-like aquaporin
MSPFLAEFLGTTRLVLSGDGVVANVLLSRSKGQNGTIALASIGNQGTASSRAIVFDQGGAVVAIPSLVERT